MKQKLKTKYFFFTLFFFIPLLGHKGLDPYLSYDFQKRFLRKHLLIANRGLDIQIPHPTIIKKKGYDLLLNENNNQIALENESQIFIKKYILPPDYITIEACFSISQKKESNYGIILSATKINNPFSDGWTLGYTNQYIFFVLNTKQRKKKQSIFLKSNKKIQFNKLYHIIATYDGKNSFLYINKKLSKQKKQGGTIDYPKKISLNFFGYKDNSYSHNGFIRSIRVWSASLTKKGVNHYYSHYEELLD